MRAASLIAASAVAVIANAFALVHAARNRSGSPEAEVTLTQKELRYSNTSLSDDDSGVDLTLSWTGPDNFIWPGGQRYPSWLDEQKLRSLGFDCSMSPASPNAVRFYERQRPRQAFVALENDGPAWREIDKQTAVIGQARLNSSHLVAIDADLNPGELRIRNPDRTNVVILPAVFAISLDRFRQPEANPAKIRGSIRELPSSIHVPRPFSEDFRRLAQRRNRASYNDLSYRVHLRYGASLEPWVTGVEFTK